MKIIGFCDKDTAIGLRIAGIHDVYIPQDNEISLWNQIEEKEDVGVILITETIAEKIGKRLEEYRLRHILPVIVEIPDKKGRRKEHIDYVSYLIKKAVGVEISKES